MQGIKYAAAIGLTGLGILVGSIACADGRSEIIIPEYDTSSIIDIYGLDLGDGFSNGILNYEVNGERTVEYRPLVRTKEKGINLSYVDAFCTYDDEQAGDVECRNLQGHRSSYQRSVKVLWELNPDGLIRLFEFGPAYGVCYNGCYIDSDLDGKLDTRANPYIYKIKDSKLVKIEIE